MSAPRIFDRQLLARRLDRALFRPKAGADFLLARAGDDLGDRLAAVTRQFDTAATLGDVTGTVAQVLAASGKVGGIVRIGPVAAGAVDVVADDETVPLAPQSMALIASLLALQWANDLPGVLAQVRRALKPDGLFLCAVLGGDTLTELRRALVAAEDEARGGASPRVAPFVDVRAMGSLMQRAGFALPVTDVDRVVVRYDSMFGLIADLRAMAATSVLAERGRPLTRGIIGRAAELYQAWFADPDGRVRATFEIISASGWAPHESQQKPLRPGSAKARLADALGVEEIRLPPGDDGRR